MGKHIVKRALPEEKMERPRVKGTVRKALPDTKFEQRNPVKRQVKKALKK